MRKILLLLILFGIIDFSFAQTKVKHVAISKLLNTSSSSVKSKKGTRTPLTILHYCNYDDTKYWYESSLNMIYFPKDTMNKYVDKNITKIGLCLDPTNVTSLKMVIWTDTTDKGSQIAYEEDVTLSDLSKGWNDIVLSTPYNITGDSLFIGFIMESTGNAYYLNETLENNNSDIVGDSDFEGFWDHLGVNYMIRVTVDDGNPYTDFALSLQTGNEYTMLPVFLQKELKFSVKATNKGNKNAPAGHIITVKDSYSDEYKDTTKTTKDLKDGATDSIGFDKKIIPFLGKHTFVFTTEDDYDEKNNTVVFELEVTDTVMARDSRTTEKTGSLASWHYFNLDLWFGNTFAFDTSVDLTSVTFYCDAPTQYSTILRVYRLGIDTVMIAQSDSVIIQSDDEIERTVVFPVDSIADGYLKDNMLHLTKDANYAFVLYQSMEDDLNLESSENKGGVFIAVDYGMFSNEEASVLRLNFGKYKTYIDIITEPRDVNLCESNDAIFTVKATGLDINYQWYKGSDILSGETNDTLMIKNITLSDTGIYRCVLTNSYDEDTTVFVSLIVNELIEIIKQPISQNICEGNDILFTVEATGLDINYQWYKENEIISGKTNDTLIIKNTSDSDTGVYKCILVNSCGKDTTEKAMLVVNNLTKIITQPEDKIACKGDSVVFNVLAEGSILSYQWQKNDSVILDTTDALLILHDIDTSDNATKYKVIVSGYCGDTISKEVMLTVNTLPIAGFSYIQDKNKIIFNNSSINADSYFWNFDDGKFSTEESPSYTYTEKGTYNVKLTTTNICGSVDSVKTVEISDIAIGIDMKSKKNIQIYPNPSKGQVIVQAKDIVRIEVITANGQKIRDIQSCNEEKISINLKKESKGLYFIKVTTKQAVVMRKIVLE